MKKFSQTEPLIVNEIGMCYFAALIYGLSLINEKAKDRPDLVEDMDANALVHFVQMKGDRIAQLCYPGDEFEKALQTPVVTFLNGAAPVISRVPVMRVHRLAAQEIRETPHPSLTSREREICDLVRAGKSSPEIALALSVSVGTVRTHRYNINKKLKADRQPVLLKKQISRLAECEETVIDKIRVRRDAHRKKYGATMERTDFSRLDWLRNAQEEALDLAIYLERLIREETIPA